MPIVTDDELKRLLANGKITAISVDTSIFDEKQLNLNSAVMQATARLKPLSFNYILSSIVAKEVENHLENAAQESLRNAKKAVGKALFAFDTEKPSKDEVLEQITGGKSARDIAKERWAKYLAESGCEVIDDHSLVKTSTLFDAYFAGEPPFGTGRKKDEFPDALALNALECAAVERGNGILVVSKDGDWQDYCEKSENLYIVREIERALALIRNAPPVLKMAVHTWLVEESNGAEDVFPNIALRVENLEFSASAYPTFGDAEVSVWAGELQSIDWPREDEIRVIDFEDIEEEEQAARLVLSMPLNLVVRVMVELDFSVWDGIDKESVSMGGRCIEVDEGITVRATITVDIYGIGTDDQEIIYLDSEIDDPNYEIELGEVDVFEPEDAWNDGDQPKE
ncbi:PIN domain-containing protein [Marivita sp.]|uniref:PIN domain-containing protein n=1 Tax=Marivita sp. TaxID=2003365 RepID=UPI003A86F6C0